MSIDTKRPVAMVIRATQRGRHEIVLRRRELLILATIVVTVLVAARVWGLGERPGLEWDEPVYASVAGNLAQTGELVPKQWVGGEGQYLYHPPFYFYILAGWFRLTESVIEPGAEAARVLAVLGSLLMLGMVALLLRRQPGGRGALVLLGVLALDGWLLFTNRIGLIENLMFPIGIGGLVGYQWAFEERRSSSEKTLGYVGAGLLLGFATVFKHTGAYLLLVPAIHWMITRKDLKRHLCLGAASIAVVVAYLLGMAASFGEPFWEQYRIQLIRSLGLVESRGSIALTDLVAAAVGTYLPFVVTVVTAAFSAGLVLLRTFQAFRAKSLEALRGPGSLYYSWAVAGMLSFGVLGIRLPQYFMLVFVPLYIYAGTEIVHHVRRRLGGREYTTALYVGMVLAVVGLNMVAFTSRIMVEGDNAIRETAAYVSETYSAQALVLADEPIGVSIPMPYVQLDAWAAASNPPKPDVIVTMTSLTQQLPQSKTLDNLLRSSRLVYTTRGFKEEIRVYEAP